LWFVVACAIGSTWYIRNWIVTGNPVYAFFYKILGGKNVNPAVMAAAEKEWQANGYGIGLFGPTVLEHIKHAWGFFTGFDVTKSSTAPSRCLGIRLLFRRRGRLHARRRELRPVGRGSRLAGN
jgi:hypothetical protein